MCAGVFAKPESLFMGQAASGVGLRSSPLSWQPHRSICPPHAAGGGVSLSGGGCKTNHLVRADNLEQINVSSADLRINTRTVSQFHTATADLSTVVVWKCWNVTFLKLSFWSLFLWQIWTQLVQLSVESVSYYYYFLRNQYFYSEGTLSVYEKKIAKYFVIL